MRRFVALEILRQCHARPSEYKTRRNGEHGTKSEARHRQDNAPCSSASRPKVRDRGRIIRTPNGVSGVTMSERHRARGVMLNATCVAWPLGCDNPARSKACDQSARLNERPMSRAFVNEDSADRPSGRRFLLPPPDDPSYDAAAARAILEAARDGDTGSAEQVTGYY